MSFVRETPVRSDWHCFISNEFLIIVVKHSLQQFLGVLLIPVHIIMVQLFARIQDVLVPICVRSDILESGKLLYPST